MCVKLSEESPFHAIFEHGEVPVRTLVPETVDLEGIGLTRCYLLNPKACTRDELEAVVKMIADRFDAPLDAVRKELVNRGLPIREDQCTCGPSIPLKFII